MTTKTHLGPASRMLYVTLLGISAGTFICVLAIVFVRPTTIAALVLVMITMHLANMVAEIIKDDLKRGIENDH